MPIKSLRAAGETIIPYGAFLGYRKGPDGMPEIDPEQAETVRYIYRAFLEGKAPSYIARDLTARGILTPGGKTTWRPNTVMSILTNEKYKGDALLQKTFCTDFLTKAYKVNEGEVPQYYVEHSHPAIIDRAMFDAVQTEIGVIQDEGRITGFDETLWLNTVDRLWIKPDGTMRFEFKGGPAIEG